MTGHGPVKIDPAVERWNNMRENVYRHFRWTSRTTWVGFCGVLLVPATIWYISSTTELRWNWAGKQKGELLSATHAAVETH